MIDDVTMQKHAAQYIRNPQDMPIGSIAYYITWDAFNPPAIKFGLVEAHYTYSIVLTMLDVNRSGRSIEGVPYNEFTATEWRKLPKNWNYQMRLFELEWGNYGYIMQRYKDIDVTDPKSILQAYNDGILVKTEDNDYGKVQTEIDRTHGWRIVKSYYNVKIPPWNKSFDFREVYKDYASAQTAIEKHNTDLERIMNMTDEEYAIYEFTKVIDETPNISEKYRQHCKDFLMQQDNKEDIVVRRHSGGTVWDIYIQWKYNRNQRWNTIER